MNTENLKYVSKELPKLDSMALVTGKPVYLDDVAPKDCLVVKVLRSPHASAVIETIQTEKAMLVPGIEGIYTWEDVPQSRFTMAGQTYPEPSPYDRLILDRRVRYVGDPVAIVAGADEKCVDKALKMIKVTYQVEEPVLDFHTAKDNPVLVHPEESWKSLCPVGADNKRNLCASDVCSDGDVDAVMADCDVVVEGTYHTKANQQAMMETFRTYCSIDAYGRLNVVSSTQIVFHVRRIISNALGIPKSKIRVTKPRIGGGFGAKQSVVSEVFPAFVTWKTGKPSKMIFSRKESQIASSPRHEMEVTVKVGASKDGTIRAVDLYTLSNTGAYGEHGPTTVGLSGHKSIPLYSKNVEAFRFAYDVVYTNVMSAGAYRGYGATQGIFALESLVSELADKLGMDPTVIREKNLVAEGMNMPAYYNEPNDSCALDRCMARAKEMIGWDTKERVRDMGNGKVRSMGVAMAMQGSGISNLDVGSATIKLNDDGLFTLLIGAADMGTGCDTTMAQVAAEVLQCSYDQIMVLGADTDASPYDSGSYASSTAFVTGKAVEKAAQQMVSNILENAAAWMGITDESEKEALCYENGRVYSPVSGREMSLAEIAKSAMAGPHKTMEVTVSHCCPTSPPPYMVGIAEVEIDKETGSVELVDYAAAIDCGTPLNRNLARVQVEGGIGQGIGMALYEDIQYNEKGRLYNNSFMQYKIPTRQDMKNIRVEFESSYEDRGPFGAKSIGEIVINTPSPALNNAIAGVTGCYFHELPITPEKILKAIRENEKNRK
ncbi:MAG: molybdopterin-dependent oxidoreductase [Lachnospiraceae bacterium]|nr:molybdopterin-dependent oxidoreductase [Lachnospiraceae bacterium]